MFKTEENGGVKTEMKWEQSHAMILYLCLINFLAKPVCNKISVTLVCQSHL